MKAAYYFDLNMACNYCVCVSVSVVGNTFVLYLLEHLLNTHRVTVLVTQPVKVINTECMELCPFVYGCFAESLIGEERRASGRVI